MDLRRVSDESDAQSCGMTTQVPDSGPDICSGSGWKSVVRGFRVRPALALKPQLADIVPRDFPIDTSLTDTDGLATSCDPGGGTEQENEDQAACGMQTPMPAGRAGVRHVVVPDC